MFRNNFIRASKSADGKKLQIEADSEAAAEIQELRMTWAELPDRSAVLAAGADRLPLTAQTEEVYKGPFSSPWTLEIPLEGVSADTVFLIAASALRKRTSADGAERFEADTWLAYIPLDAGFGAASVAFGAPKTADVTSPPFAPPLGP